jgi:hypothetical protein
MVKPPGSASNAAQTPTAGSPEPALLIHSESNRETAPAQDLVNPGPEAMSSKQRDIAEKNELAEDAWSHALNDPNSAHKARRRQPRILPTPTPNEDLICYRCLVR